MRSVCYRLHQSSNIGSAIKVGSHLMKSGRDAVKRMIVNYAIFLTFISSSVQVDHIRCVGSLMSVAPESGSTKHVRSFVMTCPHWHKTAGCCVCVPRCSNCGQV